MLKKSLLLSLVVFSSLSLSACNKKENALPDNLIISEKTTENKETTKANNTTNEAIDLSTPEKTIAGYIAALERGDKEAALEYVWSESREKRQTIFNDYYKDNQKRLNSYITLMKTAKYKENIGDDMVVYTVPIENNGGAFESEITLVKSGENWFLLD